MYIEEIIEDLADNFREGDDEVLRNIFEDVKANALSISNNTIDNLKSEIKLCVKQIYLQRGNEFSSSVNESGSSYSIIDPYQALRDNIIKNGKRRLY